MNRVPKGGVVGEQAMREAAASDFQQIIAMVAEALRRITGTWVSIDSIYPDRVVVVGEAGRYYAYPYSIDDSNAVVLGNRTEVLVEYTPVGTPLREAARPSPLGGRGSPAASVFIEALAADASAPPRYLVRVIRAGASINGVDYPASVLREAAPLFDRTRVFVKSDGEHLRGDAASKDFRQLVGRLVEPRFVEAANGDGGEIQAVLEVLETSDVADKLREAVQRDMTDLFGLSIDALGRSKKRGTFREATSILKVQSVDLIIEPGAGGQVIRFVEAVQQESDPMRQQMLRFIEARDPARARALASASDDEVFTAYTEAVQAAPNNPTTTASPGAGAPAPATIADVDARLRLVEARAEARATIAASRLPAPLQERLVTRFAEASAFTAADVTAAIQAEQQLLGRLAESGAQIRGLGAATFVPGQDWADKVSQRLDEFFDPSRPVQSFREAYIDITGDQRVTGRVENCDLQRLREAAGGTRFVEAVSASTFSNILGNSITRAMLRDYGNLEAYGDWRVLVDVVPVNDFRTQERTRMGGYGNLPAVNENGGYNALTSPGDEKATYALTKRGGTETVSLETVANDDVGVLRRIPMALANAAGRTLFEFVFDFLATNSAIYDAAALFHASHNNLGTAALDATSFAAARLAIKAQAELSSSKKLGLTLRHLFVPSALEEAAYDLFVRNTNNDETFVQSRKPTCHVIDYWSDANNWFATADRAQTPLIQLGFYGGREEPELFVQDLPTQGSLFSNDQIKYKIRHIYSGAVMDYRGFYGAIVA